MCLRPGNSERFSIAYKMRRCDGLRPSRASGNAREMITDIEYSRNDRDTSSATFTGSTFSFGFNMTCFIQKLASMQKDVPRGNAPPTCAKSHRLAESSQVDRRAHQPAV